MKWALGVVFIAIFIWFGSRAIVYSNEIRASAEIDLSRSPDSPVIKVYFDRPTSIEKVLVVTSLNLSSKDAPKHFDHITVDPVNAYVSHLTGWFVVHQQSQELWVGLTLQEGKNHGELTLSVPGMLHLIEDRPEIYELTYSHSSSTLPEIASSALRVEYAKVHSVRVTPPKWGEIEIGKSNGWTKIHGGSYVPNLTTSGICILAIRRNMTEMARWLKESLGGFAAGLALAGVLTMVFVGLVPRIRVRHRVGSVVVVCIACIVLVTMSGGFPLNYRVILFDGAGILGFIAPFVALIILPSKMIYAIRKFFLELRKS